MQSTAVASNDGPTATNDEHAALQRPLHAEEDVAAQRDHASNMSDGHCRGTGDLSESAANGLLRLLMPAPQTSGFDLCSPRVMQVWLALCHHALRHGKWGTPESAHDYDPRYLELRIIRTKGLYATWTEDLLARVCGIERKTVERCLFELTDLGWIRKSRVRDADGQFAGFSYVLLIPPTTLTDAATNRYRAAIQKKQERLDEDRQRLLQARPDYQTQPRKLTTAGREFGDALPLDGPRE